MRVITLLALLARGMPTPPPAPVSGGGSGSGSDDSGEPCVPCELVDCEDDTEPEAEDEPECAEAADAQVCVEYVWTDCE